MAVSVLVDAVDRTSYWRMAGESSIDKQRVVERATLAMRDVTYASGAYRPQNGQVVRIFHDADLLFGGPIKAVQEMRLDDEGPIATIVTARGWESLAEEIVVIELVTGYMDATVLGHYLFELYLEPRGVTWIGATSGGPTIAPLTYETTRLSEIYEEIRKLSGLSLRINGDLEAAMVVPGGITAPFTVTGLDESALLGLNFTKQSRSKATQVFVRTGTPPSGAGPVMHQETHALTGSATHYPINVLAKRRFGAVNHTGGYTAGATAMALDGMVPLASLRAFDTFQITNHGTTTYVVDAASTSNAEGAFASVSFTPALVADVPDDAIVAFDARTFVRVQVDGGDVGWGSGADFDAATQTIVLVAPPDVDVTYITPLTFPATVRVWSNAIRQADGSLDQAAVIDAQVEARQITDVAWAKAFGDATLAQRTVEPCDLSFVTRQKGAYPLQKIPVSLAEHNLSADFLIESVTITLLENDVRYALECIEGDEYGRLWDEVFREMWGSGSGGGVGGGSAIGGGGVGAPSGTGPVRIPLGGDNYFSDNPASWTDIANAVPLACSPALAGTYTLRTPRYIKVDPVSPQGTAIEIRLYDFTNNVTYATVASTTSGTWATATTSVTLPVGAGVCLLQYQMSGGTEEGVVGQCMLERD